MTPPKTYERLLNYHDRKTGKVVTEADLMIEIAPWQFVSAGYLKQKGKPMTTK